MRTQITVELDIVHELPLPGGPQLIANIAEQQLTRAALLGQRDPKLSVRATVVGLKEDISTLPAFLAGHLGHTLYVSRGQSPTGRARSAEGRLIHLDDQSLGLSANRANRTFLIPFEEVQYVGDSTDGSQWSRA